jgi:chromosome segregation ATPase
LRPRPRLRYGLSVMHDLWPLLLGLLLVSIAYLIVQHRSLATWKQRAEKNEADRSKAQSQVTALESKLDTVRTQLEDLRSEIRDTKTKLKKQRRMTAEASAKKKSIDRSEDPERPAYVVRVSPQELESEHREAMDAVRAAQENLTEENIALRRELEALRAQTVTPSAIEAVAETDTAEADAILALEAAKNDLASELREARQKLRHTEKDKNIALRKARSHTTLYQVIKGQLDLAEDKLAMMRMKYEGAKDPRHIKEGRSDPAEHEPLSSDLHESHDDEATPLDSPTDLLRDAS